MSNTTTTTTSGTFDAMWDAPLSDRGFFRYANGLRLCGLKHGALSVLGLRDVPGLGRVLDLHEAGSTHWTGRGMRPGYTGARIHTLVLDSSETNGAIRYVLLSSVPASGNVESRERSTRFAIERLEATS